MRRLSLFFVCVATAACSQSPARTNPAFERLDDDVALLSKITGLKPLKRVQYDTITRAGVKTFLEERIKEEIEPEEIAAEELTLKRFGLVPRDFDLKKTTVDLITEQAAAFYDYRKKKLFLLEGEGTGNGLEARTVVIHELAHALADQHFDLGKYIKRGRSDDASTARMAVMEGQATWLMLESMAQKTGGSVRQMPQMMDLMGASEAMTSQFPVLASAPLYIRSSLIFPYNQGVKFQHALVVKLGNAAFSRVFREAPISTQQVIHPEVYLAGTQPLKVKVPEFKGKEWKTMAEGSFGEFDHAILIEQFLSKKEAGEIAPKWRGGSYALAENRGKEATLLYASEWTDAACARRMFEAYERVMKGKWKRFDVTSRSDNSLEGTGDDGPFRLQLDGTRVTSVEGPGTPDAVSRRIN